jgi:hypothetical protein
LWFLGFYQFQNHRTPQFSIFLLFFLSYSLLEFDLIFEFVILNFFFFLFHKHVLNLLVIVTYKV